MIKINKSKKSSPLSKGRGKPWIHSRNCELHDWVIARSWSKVGIGFYFCWVNFYFSVIIRFRLSSRGEAVAIQIVKRLIWSQSRLLRYRSQWRSKEPGLLHSVRNDSRSSRVSETNVAIQIKAAFNLDCFATARNDGQRNLDCFAVVRNNSELSFYKIW